MKTGAKEFISEELTTIFRVLKGSFGMRDDETVDAVHQVLDEVSTAIKSLNISSYVLITTTPGKVSQVLNKVKELPAVREAHLITGTYDIIALLKTKDIDELRETITGNIHKLSDVDSTATSLVIK